MAGCGPVSTAKISDPKAKDPKCLKRDTTGAFLPSVEPEKNQGQDAFRMG